MNINDAVTFVIGGDTVPVGDGLKFFVEGNVSKLVEDELSSIIKTADFSVFNLEVPLADEQTPVEKCGPNLIAPTQAICGLTRINPGVFALANNHILDQGEAGLISTLNTLTSAGAGYFGAGKDINEAAKPFVFEANGMRIGFYACAEHEFSIATDTASGANPFDALESLDHISSLKEECDYVVVLYHGGKEHYRYPSPLLQKVCRKIAEKGADLVVCQHSHCVGCEEKYLDSTIVYGQGNFLFDYNNSECWQTGLLVRVRVDGISSKVEYLPIKKEGFGVRLADDAEARSIMKGFEDRSVEIRIKGFVEEQYEQYSMTMLDSYLGLFIPGARTLVYRAINKLCKHKLAITLFSRSRLFSSINCVECEAHRELLLAGLRKATK